VQFLSQNTPEAVCQVKSSSGRRHLDSLGELAMFPQTPWLDFNRYRVPWKGKGNGKVGKEGKMKRDRGKEAKGRQGEGR